ncbi:MAG: hypothetical protein CFE23_11900 [Flavobacterium sp. BFFFF1]|uniref:carboxypeptidase-like regulatory domain-containing protein n=1 Tax=Flavobacterium sp. BFFFF1 TaxID=2015557 RepID=UPI000BC4E4F0|nr:carboxypeptidase-like regulatory domain-containing protein [Flavobacterium sp. BFFFF1]OYU79951.1 MAG: hypothetical protein CFE23_11900 [Flavobacterium sp. BFFFF1]
MKIRQERKLDMYNVTSGFLTATDVAIINQMPQFTVVHDKLKAVIDRIEAASQVQVRQTTGYTQQRDALREPIETQATEITRRITVFAINTSNVSLEQMMKFSKSGIHRMTNKQFIANARTIVNLVNPIIKDVEAYGVTQPMIDEFLTEVEALDNYLPEPRTAVVNRTYSTAEINAMFREGDRLLKLLDKYVAMLEFREADFFKRYRLCRSIIDPAVRKRSLAGTVTDEDGQPLRNVRVAIAGKPSTLSSDTGAFHFPHLTAGEYPVAFARNGYKDLIVNALITNGTRTTLNVVLSEL